MENLTEFFEALYKNFNDRNIDLVIPAMTNDVKWANGMEGGHVYGQAAVKDYWTRQFTMVSAKVVPLEIKNEHADITIKVHQVVHDVEGNLLGDEIIEHIFHLTDDKISEFNIGKN